LLKAGWMSAKILEMVVDGAGRLTGFGEVTLTILLDDDLSFSASECFLG